jgi:NAD(P)-dependent dehydrogenase (short-subunit alcohol dehydrogenase family)
MSTKVHAFIVTGAGSGIGRAIAHKIASEGHPVFGLGRDAKKLESLTKELGAKSFTFAAADLSKPAESVRACGEIRRWLKDNSLELRGLVNNAGIADRLPFSESSDEVWERQFQNNLLSAVRLAREFYPELRQSSFSSVLNISSNLGVRPIAGMVPYSAIKAAMNSWTQGLAKEWAEDKIRVNCLCPGLVDTPIHPFHKEDESSATRKQAHQIVPLGRMGTSEEIAAAAWFFLSDASTWTTGSVLTIDGGLGL